MKNKSNMRTFVVNLLKENLPEFYYYHNYEHTLYVAEKTQEIGKYERCTEEELKLLNAAALWHDTGYIRSSADHEEESCRMARQYLPDFGFSSTDIQKICRMIMATKLPQAPKTKSEEILADADLEYLGTNQYEQKAAELYRELHHLDPSLTKRKWKEEQVSFLQKHHFFTLYCRENKEPLKRIHINRLAYDE